MLRQLPCLVAVRSSCQQLTWDMKPSSKVGWRPEEETQASKKKKLINSTIYWPNTSSTCALQKLLPRSAKNKSFHFQLSAKSSQLWTCLPDLYCLSNRPISHSLKLKLSVLLCSLLLGLWEVFLKLQIASNSTTSSGQSRHPYHKRVKNQRLFMTTSFIPNLLTGDFVNQKIGNPLRESSNSHKFYFLPLTHTELNCYSTWSSANHAPQCATTHVYWWVVQAQPRPHQC